MNNEELIKKIIKDKNFNFIELKKNLINSFFKEKKGYSFEDKKQKNHIDPEIFSLLEELELNIENNRYETGSYYTNRNLIKKIIKEKDLWNKKVIDPAAGTGNFLIQLLIFFKNKFNNKFEFINYIEKNIYYNEIKKTSIDIFILRLRFLSYSFFKIDLNEKDISRIRNNIFNDDFLLNFNKEEKYDAIIGNPPYLGTKSLGKEYLNKIKKVYGFTDDLYSLFIFKSIPLLKENGFLSFVTSSTYMTITSKERLRNLLINNGIYKIIKNHKDNFNIKTQTSTLFLNKNYTKKQLKIYNEVNLNKLTLEKEIALKSNQRFITYENNISELFNKVSILYDQYKKDVHTTKSLEKFIKTKTFNKLITENEYLPLGLIAYIATGVDFKGQNKNTLFSLDNKKYNLIKEKNRIKYDPNSDDFKNGLENYQYIPAKKGKDDIFVLWTKEHVDYLKDIKAPLRNIRLYGEKEKLYCKTSTYEFFIADKHTLCINTAGACFVLPVLENISIENIKQQIESDDIKDYLKNNVNNSLCLTPNDLKLIPIKVN